MGNASNSDKVTLVSRLLRRDISLRGALRAFAVFVCVAIVAVFAVDARRARDVVVAAAQREATNLSGSLAQQASDTIEGVSGTLLALAQQVETDQTGPAARIRLRNAMAAFVTAMPRLAGLIIVDEHGRFVASNISASPGWLPVDTRPYVRYHRLHAESGIQISRPARWDVAGSWVIFITRRLEHADGSFAGVAIAPVTLDYFGQLYASVDIGKAGTITLFNDAGVVMVRQPRREIGRNFRDAGPFVAPYKYLTAGSYVRRSHVDGVLRLFAFQRLGEYPLVMQVALAEREYLAAWRASTLMELAALGLIIGLIAVLAGGLGAQIGRRKAAEESLEQLALVDGLTGIANRRQFDRVFGLEWRRAEREQTPLALMMIDVDNFKGFNDSYGHLHGDDALIRIAATIAAGVVRSGDLAARYGGEEFAVLLPGADAASAVTVAERIRTAIVDLRIPHAGLAAAVVSVSVGVASLIPDRAAQPATLISAADSALYDSKRLGRNRTSVKLAVPGPIAPP